MILHYVVGVHTAASSNSEFKQRNLSESEGLPLAATMNPPGPGAYELPCEA